ncbi:uncharacterized protein WCC33_008912 [Rhinophrynus dorsalis]
MQQIRKGREKAENEGRKLSALLPSHDLSVSPRVAQSIPQPHVSPTAENLGAWTDWTRDLGPQSDLWPQETAAGTRCPEDIVIEPLDKKEKRSVLPLIKKQAGRGTGMKSRNTRPFTDCPSTTKSSQERVKQKSQALSAGEIAPWVSESPSESSLCALLHSIPPSRPCSENAAYITDSAEDTQTQGCNSLQTIPLAQQLLRDKSNGRAKQRGRTGVSKRRSLNKVHGMKFPPLPAISELSFSRNFSFSFFELPEHQSPQQWLQRQRLVYMTMRQLHY